MDIKPNNIYNIDCFEGLKYLPAKSIDLVVTDPPYLHIKGHGMNHKTGKPYKNGNSTFANSELYDQSGYMMHSMNHFGENQIDAALKEFVRVLKVPNMYIFCNETQVPYYTMWAEKNGLMFSILIWEKPLSIINRNRFSQNIEFIIRIYDYGTALNKIEINKLYNRVWKQVQVSPAEKIHPTQKPIELVQRFILLSSNEDDVVLDPFIGSGTTAEACIKEKRNFIGFEINTEYYNAAIKRVSNNLKQLTLF